MGYSLHQKALAEFLGMAITIYTGEAALANELLPSTKGHGMGWGFTVLIFGFAFYLPLQLFGPISAALNPAMLLAKVVLGKADGVTFIVLSLCEIAGAMLGALLHWLHFLPHYKTVPEPPAMDRTDNMLRRRDTLQENALQIASYNTRVERQVTGFKSPLDGVLYYLKNKDVVESHTADELLEDYFHATEGHLYGPRGDRKHSVLRAGIRDDTALPTTDPAIDRASRPLARRTIQVADLQQHLADLHVQGVLRQRRCPTCINDTSDSTDADAHAQRSDQSPSSGSPRAAAPLAGTDTARSAVIQSAAGTTAATAAPPTPPSSSPLGVIFHSFSSSHNREAAGGATQGGATRAGGKKESLLKSALKHGSGPKKTVKLPAGYISEEQKRANALYQAALRADQNAKLSVFATRPAIYVPLYNFITEMLGTAMLIVGALMVELSAFYIPKGPARDVFTGGIQAFLITWVIVYLIGGLGGPTSYAANPARDLGPRIMHQLLPIPNKGPSEWQYAWVPVVAPLVGGVMAAGVYRGIEYLVFPGGVPL